MLKYHSLVTILVFAFCILGVLGQLSNDTPSPNSNITCQDNLNYTREEFSIDICLVNQGSQYAAMISLQNNNTFDSYELKVSQSYIDQNIQMSVLYQNPFKFFSMLKQEECNITTNSDAQILLKYKLFRMLKLMPRKQILNKIDIIQRQFQTQQDLMNRIRQQSSSEIIMLNNNMTQISSKKNLFKTAKDSQIASINQDTLSLNSMIVQDRPSNELQSTEIKQIQLILNSELSLLQRLNTNNLQRFASSMSGKNLKIKYIGTNGHWHGYIKTLHIQPGRITRLQVRQTKTFNRQAMYGVSTDKILGSRWFHYHVECKAYYSYAAVFQNGGGRSPTVLARNTNGMIVTIIADMINWKISWEVNGVKVAQAEISAAMKANKLYFIIGLFNQNDEVEILDF